MKEFRIKTIINASAIIVWETITDINTYPQFDKNCKQIDGKIHNGKDIIVHTELKQRKLFTKTRVKIIKPYEIMVWEVRLPFYLFINTKTFNVIAKDDQTTEFILIETFEGYLIDWFPNVFIKINKHFKEFAKSLKYFIESRL